MSCASPIIAPPMLIPPMMQSTLDVFKMSGLRIDQKEVFPSLNRPFHLTAIFLMISVFKQILIYSFMHRHKACTRQGSYTHYSFACFGI